jgi:hypothetical protein
MLNAVLIICAILAQAEYRVIPTLPPDVTLYEVQVKGEVYYGYLPVGKEPSVTGTTRIVLDDPARPPGQKTINQHDDPVFTKQTPRQRDKIWRDALREQGLREAALPSGEKRWYPADEVERADRSRELEEARQKRLVTKETPSDPIEPTEMVDETATEGPGFLTLWGGHILLVLVTVILLAVILKTMVFASED